ncbi:hypothetical protein ACM1PE_25850 [Achromobacter sp. PD1]|uniref:hypothetical protein n=1 Tax=Achromobacter sp. PD1 TaxID=3399125 RepID=UPI003AF88EBD
MANLGSGTSPACKQAPASITGPPGARINRLFFVRCMHGGNAIAVLKPRFPGSGSGVVNGLFSTVTFAVQLQADAGYSAAFPIILGRHTTMWHAQPGLYACAVAPRAAAR